MTELNSFESVEYTTEQLQQIIDNYNSDAFTIIENNNKMQAFRVWKIDHYYEAGEGYWLSKNPNDNLHYDHDTLENIYDQEDTKHIEFKNQLKRDYVLKCFKGDPFRIKWHERKVLIQVWTSLTAKNYIDFTMSKKYELKWQAPKTRKVFIDWNVCYEGIIKYNTEVYWKLFHNSFDSWVLPFYLPYVEVVGNLRSYRKPNIVFEEGYLINNCPIIKEKVNQWIESLESPPDHE